MVKRACSLLFATFSLFVEHSSCNTNCNGSSLPADFRAHLVEGFKQQILDKLGMTHPPNLDGAASRPKLPPTSRLLAMLEKEPKHHQATDDDSAKTDLILALVDSREYLILLRGYAEKKVLIQICEFDSTTSLS